MPLLTVGTTAKQWKTTADGGADFDTKMRIRKNEFIVVRL